MIHDSEARPVYAIGDKVFVRRADGDRVRSERVFAGTIRKSFVIEKDKRELVTRLRGTGTDNFPMPLYLLAKEGPEKYKLSSEIWHWVTYLIELDYTGEYIWAAGQTIFPRGDGKVNALRTRRLYECTDPKKKTPPRYLQVLSVKTKWR